MYQERLALLRQYFINPWYDSSLLIGAMILGAGLFVYWYSQRFNNSKLFMHLAYLMGFHAVFFAIFFHLRFPPVLIIFVEFALLVATMVYVNTILTTLLVLKIIDLGVDESYLYYHDNSNIKLEVLGGAAVLILATAWFAFGGEGPFLFLLQGLGGAHGAGGFLFWLVMLLLVPLVTLVSRELIPWKGEMEAALLGEDAPPRELENIFSSSGPASKSEIFLACLVVIVVYALFILLAKEDRQPMDWFGVFVLVAIIYSIFRKETTKRKVTEVPEELRRRKSAWTSSSDKAE